MSYLYDKKEPNNVQTYNKHLCKLLGAWQTQHYTQSNRQSQVCNLTDYYLEYVNKQ